MLDYADMVGSTNLTAKARKDALRDVKKQYRRNHQLFDAADEEIPVLGTMASRFNDPGTNRFYQALIRNLTEKFDLWLGNQWESGPGFGKGHP